GEAGCVVVGQAGGEQGLADDVLAEGDGAGAEAQEQPVGGGGAGGALGLDEDDVRVEGGRALVLVAGEGAVEGDAGAVAQVGEGRSDVADLCGGGQVGGGDRDGVLP